MDQSKEMNSGVIIDDACYELMFVKEKNVKIKNGNEGIYLLPSSYTLNNLTGPFKFEFPETFSTFCIKLQPWMNASYVPTERSQVLDLNKIYPEHIDELHFNIFNAETIEGMVIYAEQFLETIEIKTNEKTELIRKICDLIYLKSGNISVNEIAEEFNIYRQKLNLIFKQETKYTLKNFINCVRIRACLGYKLKNPKISLTEIGYMYGYFDQAHFIKSFKSACGVTPSEYVKNPGYSFVPTKLKK